MQVHQILRSKAAGRKIVTVAPGTRLAEIAGVLSANRIGSVVVAGVGGAPQGIVSERDIVRAVARRGVAALQESAMVVMTRSVASCTPQESAHSVLSRMTEGRFRHMPVMEQREMIGIISIGDVVKARLSELAMEKDALAGMIMGQ